MSDQSLDRHLARLLQQVGQPQPERVRACLLQLQAELLRWNRRHNLTAIIDPHRSLELHLADALTLLPHLPPDATLLDIGSGAGFPGLPLKVVRPDLKLVSVDAVAKKIHFQRHIARLLALDGVDLRHGRAELLAEDQALAGRCQVATARAFGKLELLARLARPCLEDGGTLIAMKGPEGEEEALAAAEPLLRLGFHWRGAEHYSLPDSGHRHCLLIWTFQGPSSTP